MSSVSLTNSQPLILQLLLDAGVLDPKQLEAIREAHAKERGLLENVLVKLGAAGDQQIAEAYSKYLKVPLMPELPDDATLDAGLSALLPEKLCRESLLVPVARQGDVLDVAFVSPDDMLVLDELQLLTGMTIRPLIGPLRAVAHLIETLYSARQMRPEFAGGADDFAKSSEDEHYQQRSEDHDDDILELDRPPPPGQDGRIIRMVNQVLEQALRMGASLPGMTQFVVDASDFVVHYGLYICLGIAAITVAFRQYMQTETGRRRVGGVGLALPLVGDLIVQSAMYRFASNSALLLKSGIPMLETLAALESIFQTNPVNRDAFARTRSRVAAGRPLAASLEETGLFTTMMTNMVRIGEQSGQLALVVEQIAPYYKEKMEGLIAKATKLLEPVIIMGMGITVAGLMMSIYLPMFEMAGKIH